MSSIWTFSASSEPYFQRCLAAAPPPDPNNKWFIKFGQYDPPKELTLQAEKTPVICEINSQNLVEDNMKDASSPDESFFDTIESDSIVPVDYVLQECSKHPKVIVKLATQIPTTKVQQIFNHIISKNYAEKNFIYEFLPAYIKVQYSRLCIDLLLKLNEQYEIFKKLLELLINDKEIPDVVLNIYVGALNEESLTSFVITLSNIELTPDGFKQNLLAIYTAYKGCIKNDQIQECIQKMLVDHSVNCSSERTFGRLFLIFLQKEKSMDRKYNLILEQCLEIHRSPFKRPCMTLLKELSD